MKPDMTDFRHRRAQREEVQLHQEGNDAMQTVGQAPERSLQRRVDAVARSEARHDGERAGLVGQDRVEPGEARRTGGLAGAVEVEILRLGAEAALPGLAADRLDAGVEGEARGHRKHPAAWAGGRRVGAPSRA